MNMAWFYRPYLVLSVIEFGIYLWYDSDVGCLLGHILACSFAMWVASWWEEDADLRRFKEWVLTSSDVQKLIRDLFQESNAQISS
jgi:hypothetical protein